MVARIISGKDIKGALNYNEQKVMEGKATCIQANLFSNTPEALSFTQKLNRFTNLNARNMRSKTNTLHISLNFDMTENLNTDTLNKIATTYMDKIGFGEQPYLVYQHTDAAHPHLHIVTTLIQQDGKRIPIHFLGKNQSESARKEIEIEFNLTKAQQKTKIEKELFQPIEVKKVIYGKSETKRNISNIVRMVTRSYKFTSLSGLNAILNQYNVHADRGSEKSQMFAKRGLIYCLIDQNKKRIGIPIKASSIYDKPTLAFLEKQFKINAILRQPLKSPLIKQIEKALLNRTVTSKDSFKHALQKHGITVVFFTNPEGRTYGISFVDNNQRVAFNGSDLGKAYSATAILNKLVSNEKNLQPFRPGYTPINSHPAKTDSQMFPALSELRSPDDTTFIPPEIALKPPRKKKRRKGFSK